MSGDGVVGGWRAAAALQGGLAATTFVALAFFPPQHGRTLLVPLDGHPVSDALLERTGLDRVTSGPLPGSAIVEGVGRPLAAVLFDKGIIMVAAPKSACAGRSMHGEGAHG